MDITRNIPSHLDTPPGSRPVAWLRNRAPEPLWECSAPGCGAEAGPLPGPTSGRDLCPEHRDDERHELERIAERACPPCPFCSLESSRPDGPCPRCELEQGWDYWAEKQPEHLECVMNAIRDALNYWKERDGGAEA